MLLRDCTFLVLACDHDGVWSDNLLSPVLGLTHAVRYRCIRLAGKTLEVAIMPGKNAWAT